MNLAYRVLERVLGPARLSRIPVSGAVYERGKAEILSLILPTALDCGKKSIPMSISAFEVQYLGHLSSIQKSL
jgi:hypothetical protein